MREILFKAKRLDNGEWVEGYYQKRKDYDEQDEHLIFRCVSYHSWEYAKVDPRTICQYTGLTDKAKNKAFENSIIKVISEDEFGVIKYGEYANPFDNSSAKHIGFYVEWQNKTGTNLWRKDLGYWLNNTTIIVGDIFDNVELLEGCE